MKRGSFLHWVPILFLILLILPVHLKSQTYVHVTISQAPVLAADAGADQTIDVGQSVTLGGTPAAIGGTGSLTFFWDPPYHIESTDVPNPLATPPGDITYTLLVTDERGCTSTDRTKVFVTGGISGIADGNTEGNLIVYPNPSIGVFILEIQGSRVVDMRVTVFTMTGQAVYNTILSCAGTVPAATIDLSALPRGSYILRISGDFNDIYRNIILK